MPARGTPDRTRRPPRRQEHRGDSGTIDRCKRGKSNGGWCDMRDERHPADEIRLAPDPEHAGASSVSATNAQPISGPPCARPIRKARPVPASETRSCTASSPQRAAGHTSNRRRAADEAMKPRWQAWDRRRTETARAPRRAEARNRRPVCQSGADRRAAASRARVVVAHPD